MLNKVYAVIGDSYYIEEGAYFESIWHSGIDKLFSSEEKARNYLQELKTKFENGGDYLVKAEDWQIEFKRSGSPITRTVWYIKQYDIEE